MKFLIRIQWSYFSYGCHSQIKELFVKDTLVIWRFWRFLVLLENHWISKSYFWAKGTTVNFIFRFRYFLKMIEFLVNGTLKKWFLKLRVFEAITCLEFSVNLTVAFVKGDFLPKISTFGQKIDFRRTANSFWLILMNHRLPLFTTQNIGGHALILF